MTNQEQKKLSLGFLGAGGKLNIVGGFLEFKHPYGRFFKVPVKDINTVTVDVVGLGKCKLKIIGNGTELASTDMPKNWAFKAQQWILENK